MQQKEIEKIKDMANAVRFLSLDMIAEAKSGHPGLPMGCAELISTLFARHLRFVPTAPKWQNRDRFILSAGHGAALLYSLLYLTGYPDISLQDIKDFRKLGSKTSGHPEYGLLDGVEVTTGPLGQGVASAVGMAIAEKIKADRLGSDIISNKIYVLVGDGCLMEGISEEAISLAGTLKLDNLVVIWDDNNITIDGRAKDVNCVDMKARFKANNWKVLEIKNAYDIAEIDAVLKAAKVGKGPVFIDAHTVIGHGYKPVENSSAVHGTPLSCDEVEEAKLSAGYNVKPFDVPDEIFKNWQAVGKRCVREFELWNEKVFSLNRKEKEFLNLLSANTVGSFGAQATKLKKLFCSRMFSKATRAANGLVVEKILPLFQNLIGGSADLTKPTFGKNEGFNVIKASDFSGNYIQYGVREHAMAAVMNGLALSGFKAFGSTFLMFSDYLRPALRLSALMGLGCVYVFTHDSILVGEDGPTHQPVEQLASLRAIPGLNVIRPADAIETVEAWQVAIAENTKPTALIFSRQAVPLLRRVNVGNANKVAQGAYILKDFVRNEARHITLIASGSEVALAVEVQKLLRDDYDINARVVSMPSMNLFEQQSKAYKNKVIDNSTVCVSIEAGATFGWTKYADLCIGVDEFGKSGPGKDVAEAYGLVAKQVVNRILDEIRF